MQTSATRKREMRIPKKEEKKFNYSRNAVANNSAVRPPTKYDVIHRRQEIESAIHWAFSLFFNFKILTSSWMWSSLVSFLSFRKYFEQLYVRGFRRRLCNSLLAVVLFYCVRD